MTPENSGFENQSFGDQKHIIMDSANQLIPFKFHLHEGMDRIRELIRTSDVKTLEEYTHKTTSELETLKPGVTTAYNDLVIKLRNPNLEESEFEEIMKEASRITR